MKRLGRFIRRHVQVSAWIILSIGMVVIMLWSAREVALLPGQRLALMAVTVLLAGLCVWIVGLETDRTED